MRHVWRGGARSQSSCQHVWMHTVKFKSSHIVPIQIQCTKQAVICKRNSARFLFKEGNLFNKELTISIIF